MVSGARARRAGVARRSSASCSGEGRTGWAAGRPRRAVGGSGSRCPEPCIVPRPVAPAVSSQNGGGLAENMAAPGTLSPGRLRGCSSVPGTVRPRGRVSVRAPGRPARRARQSRRVPAACEAGAAPRGVRDPRGRRQGGRSPAHRPGRCRGAAPPLLPRGCPGAGLMGRVREGLSETGWRD